MGAGELGKAKLEGFWLNGHIWERLEEQHKEMEREDVDGVDGYKQAGRVGAVEMRTA